MHQLWTQQIFLFSVPLKYNTAQLMLNCLLNTVTHRKQAPFSVNAKDFSEAQIPMDCDKQVIKKNVGLASRMLIKATLHVLVFHITYKYCRKRSRVDETQAPHAGCKWICTFVYA